MGTRSKAEKQFHRNLKTTDGKTAEVSLDLKTLMEAMNPALTHDELLIPGYNCTLSQQGEVMLPAHKDGTPVLKFYFLTPHYEQMLLDLITPIIEEFKHFLDDLGGGEFNWQADLAGVLSSLGNRLITSLQDYNLTMAQAAAIITQASIELNRTFKCEEMTDADRADILKLDSTYFFNSVPTDYIFRFIILPQYKKMALSDMIGSFFLTIAKYLQVGVGNLTQKLTSSTTATTSPS